MGGNEPNCMITDQDPAMKIVVASVFTKTEHRFCMWHIMKKLPDKVEKSIMQEETGFLKKLCACVWHLDIDPAEFEERWNNMMKENGLEVAKVSEGNRARTFDVVFNPINFDTTCSCKLFYRLGIACRHLIWVWKAKRLETIPDQYMLHRWTTLALKKPVFDLGGNLLEQCANIVDKKKLLNDLWSEIHSCVSLAEGKDEDIQDLLINLQGIRKDLEAKRIARTNETTSGSTNNKEQDLELLIGVSVPNEIIVKPPKISKNKGTGVHVSNEENSKKKGPVIDESNVETRGRSAKRLKGEKEKAIEQNQKKKRLCRVCLTGLTMVEYVSL
ncbi:uncharacterized protein LOC110736607 [Chenopodium quinoa]|uniref:uncharacterized protein LOC110736607 n=1 Tax=Chenopodium quinoa TaxID=63459 RepID=UPI000B79A73E|nr:uncharacterized protein LOC110736607 [Chenopodium quinoa]